jgi:hypothetical protein
MPEEVGRLIEHMTGAKLAPDFIRDKLRSFRSYARSTEQGRVAETAGEIGSMFVPVGGWIGRGARASNELLRMSEAARAAARSAEMGRAAAAGTAGVGRALGEAETASRTGQSAVRRAMQSPGDIMERDIGREVRRRAKGGDLGKPDWETVHDYFPLKDPPFRPSQSKYWTPSSGDVLGMGREAVKPVTRAERIAMRASEMGSKISAAKGLSAARVGARRLERAARRHPTIAATTRGAVSGAVQPDEDAKNYGGTKAEQIAFSAGVNAVMANPILRSLATLAATHAAAHGATHALTPGGWLHYPAHRVATRAAHLLHPRAPSRGTQRAIGAGVGGAIGGTGVFSREEDEAQRRERERRSQTR